MIHVEFANDIARAHEWRDRLLAPLRFVLTFPHTHARMIFERIYSFAEQDFAWLVAFRHSAELMQKNPAMHPVFRGGILPLHFVGDRVVIPWSALCAGPQKRGAGIVKFRNAVLSIWCLAIRWRRHGEADRKNCFAVDDQNLI